MTETHIPSRVRLEWLQAATDEQQAIEQRTAEDEIAEEITELQQRLEVAKGQHAERRRARRRHTEDATASREMVIAWCERNDVSLEALGQAPAPAAALHMAAPPAEQPARYPDEQGWETDKTAKRAAAEQNGTDTGPWTVPDEAYGQPVAGHATTQTIVDTPPGRSSFRPGQGVVDAEGADPSGGLTEQDGQADG